MKKRIISFFIVLTMLFGIVPLQAFAAEEKKPFEGKYISVMGDSISTYNGWSDVYPITSPENTYRYGEAYYGTVGTDCHNTDLLVSDTWWHQAATELGAEPLMINSGNSTGLLKASYPSLPDWEHYLQDMLAYKSRPYYLGRDGILPDIIALYIGSGDVGKAALSEIGTVEAIDFDALIQPNGDGTFTYAVPQTVAESYCILLHKIQIAYPAAEVYCFTVVPNAGGGLDTCNKRLAKTLPFNEMVKSVADHYSAIVVDLFDEFQLDPNGDAIATESDWAKFKTYFHEDPHPNASGFDIITNRFVKTVKQNSRYVVQVETTAGNYEPIPVQQSVDMSSGTATEKRTARNYITESGLVVNYDSTSGQAFTETYTVRNSNNTYTAEGGSSKQTYIVAPSGLEVDIPLFDTDDPETDRDETKNSAVGSSTVVPGTTGDLKNGADDGVYRYEEITSVALPEVSIHTTNVSVTENSSSNEDTDLTCFHSTASANESNEFITDVSPVTVPEEISIADGYDYLYIGSDKFSKYFSAFLYRSQTADVPYVVYSDDKITLHTENTAPSEFQSRNLLVPKLYLEHTTVDEGKTYPALWSTIQQFTLVDKNGNPATAYCADSKTPAVEGFSYYIANLVDAEHYTTDDAAMIRSVANHGYWGADTGSGSLQAVKDMMSSSGQFTEQEVGMLTEGMALTATQLAIWSYSNKADGRAIVNCYYSDSVGFYKSNKQYTPDADKAALIFKLKDYISDLASTEVGSGQTACSTIINEKNFLKNPSIEIVGKSATEEKNLDADTSNDIYTANISFELDAKIDRSEDNLVMTLYNGNDEVITRGRVAGTLQEGEVYLDFDSGKYTFKDLPLAEGESLTIRFVLDGWQDLDRIPYLLISERKTVEDEENVPSQTLICIADGHHSVNVEMNLEFNMDIRDEEYTLKTHWRNETFTPPAATGTIVLTKVDAEDSSATLAGAVFKLYSADDVLVDTYTTDENGEIRVEDLPAGGYYWVEVQPPEGYVLDNTEHSCSVSADHTEQVTVSNTRGPVPDPPPPQEPDDAKRITITIKKVWNADASAKAADSVTVQLLCDGVVVKTAKLNEQNDWQVIYTDMPESDAYSIVEVNIPKGFSVTYSKSGYEFTVTNTASLIQTSQSIWPIPVLAIAGLCLIVLGVIVLRKTRNKNA